MNVYEDKFGCEEVLLNIVKFVKGELNPELSGRIKGHILICKNCSYEYEKALDNEIRLSNIIMPAPSDTGFIDRKLRKESNLFGLLWEEDKIKIVTMFSSLVANIRNIRRTKRRTMGAPRKDIELAITILNDNYKPSGEKIIVTVEEDDLPHITPRGIFKAKFYSTDKKAENRILSLTIKLAGEEKVTFTTVFKRINDNLFEALVLVEGFEGSYLIKEDEMELFLWAKGCGI